MTEIIAQGEQIVSFSPNIYEELAVIVEINPDAEEQFLEMAAMFADCVRRRKWGKPVNGWDLNSIREIDKFLASEIGYLILTNQKIYFRADLSSMPSYHQAGIVITKVGLYEERLALRVQDLVTVN